MKTGQRYGYADKSEIVKGCVIEVCKGVVLNPKHGLQWGDWLERINLGDWR